MVTCSCSPLRFQWFKCQTCGGFSLDSADIHCSKTRTTLEVAADSTALLYSRRNNEPATKNYKNLMLRCIYRITNVSIAVRRSPSLPSDAHSAMFLLLNREELNSTAAVGQGLSQPSVKCNFSLSSERTSELGASRNQSPSSPRSHLWPLPPRGLLQ